MMYGIVINMGICPKQKQIEDVSLTKEYKNIFTK